MTRKRFDVVANGASWSVKYLAAVHYTSMLKSAAIDEGVRLARANEPSQLVIHRQDGTIEDERTYGNDPFPPRG